MFKLPILALGTVASLLLVTTETVQAGVLNGGFETGNLSGWTSAGQATVEDC